MTDMLIAGRYALRDRLGRGASGVVLEAIDTRLHRLVALKLIPRPTSCDDLAAETMRRAWQEARAAGRLAHPGIVTVFDAGEGPDYIWIAMELVIGETLQALLDRAAPLPLATALRLMSELLEALGAAHRLGIVHRDVKPANILLADHLEAGPPRLLLSDFGVAQFGHTDLTQIGQVIGTPSFMAPEQLRGEVADARADLWAAAVIFHRMLTGQRAFGGDGLAMMQAILHEQPAPPSLLRPDLPPGLDAVLAHALAKRREDRFADSAAFAAALGDIESDTTVAWLQRDVPPALRMAAPASHG